MAAKKIKRQSLDSLDAASGKKSRVVVDNAASKPAKKPGSVKKAASRGPAAKTSQAKTLRTKTGVTKASKAQTSKARPSTSKSSTSKTSTARSSTSQPSIAKAARPNTSGAKAGKTGALARTTITKSAKRTLKLESQGLADLLQAVSGRMAAPFADAVEILNSATGRVIVTGMGKSGHVGHKMAATFSSTGTTAFFVHPSEASHGDLGMISSDDVILAMSWSGETVELGSILTYSRRFAVPLIAITSRPESALGKAADVVLHLPKASEACPHGLAPTTSTTMTLALGDCLAIALLEAKGFTAEDFKRFHPGGSLGAQLQYVEDVMHGVDELPLVRKNVLMSEAIVTMTQRGFGCLGVVDGRGRLIGVITDGDLRRHMSADLLSATTGEIMTPNPKSIRPDLLASAALERLSGRITALFVVEKSKPVGIVHIHDLLRAGIA
ncbi:MAG: KpsF/GutQ family sugar-phosphate isomerase [Hyphomicrobiaceae bacterium]